MLSPTTTTKIGQQLTGRLNNLSRRVSEVASPTTAPLSTPAISADVLSTTDYSLFKTIDANRPIVEAHVRHLMEQITEKDMLHLRPIDVNADFGVVDGQHRLEAARRLGRRIYYRVGQLTEDDMAALNRASRNWNQTDYLHFWASKGNESYVQLADFCQRHPEMALTSAQTLIGKFDGYKYTHFKDGLYRTGDLERGEAIANFLLQLRDETGYKYALDTRFVMAIHHCWAYVAGFEPATLLRKISLQPTELVRCATQKQYLMLFERLYNYKTTEKFQLRLR